MSDKTTVTISGFGCVVLLAFIAVLIGGFFGIIGLIAHWVASL